MYIKNCFKIVLFVLGFLIRLSLHAQPVVAINTADFSNLAQGIDLSDSCYAFIDSSKTFTIDQISKKQFSRTGFSNSINTPFIFGRQNVWIKIIIENTDLSELKLILLASRNDRINLYTPEGFGFKEQKAGFGFPLSELSNENIPNGFAITIAPCKREFFIIKLENFFKLRERIKISLFTPQQYVQYKTQSEVAGIPHTVFQSCFLACLFFMFLFTILQFSSNHYRGYVFYALFIFFNLLIFLRLLEYNSDIRWITAYLPEYYYCFENLLTAFALIFYLKFVGYFLDIKTTKEYFQRFINIVVALLSVLVVVDLIFILNRPYAFGNIYLFTIEKSINYSILSVALFQIIFNKNILTRYIVIGTAVLLFCVVFASVRAFTDTGSGKGLMVTDNFAELGVIFEILLFSIGLGHKSRVLEREKNNTQHQLIEQLKENQQLQKEMNEDLETEVKKRTDDVLRINKTFEEQRIQQMRSNFQKKIIETEMAALRAQMNPHFIFNCLNSINLFILKSEPEIASDYLTKFSRLIRLVLDNSRSQLVTLSNEITALKLYIEMEALRFANKFGYEIIVDENIDIENIEIPPMLLQPYVENAIWHGLMQYNGEGKITLLFSFRDNQLTVTIDDNGIGRDLAHRMKSKSAIEHKSHGMKVTADRIDMINRIYDTLARVEIIDKLGDTGIAFGTTVKIQIPLKR